VNLEWLRFSLWMLAYMALALLPWFGVSWSAAVEAASCVRVSRGLTLDRHTA